MAGYLSVKLLAQNDQVLAFAWQQRLVQISRVPNPRLRHEVESGAMDHGGPVPLRVRSEEDRRAENSLERSDEASILGAALLDSEGVEHFGCAIERDARRFLANCHRCQKDGNQ